MDFKNLAAQVVMTHVNGANNSSHAAAALDKLADRNKGFDLADIVNMFQVSGGELSMKARSWLGDGANQELSAQQAAQALGGNRISAFAKTLGIDGEEAGQKLAQILPELIDKSSQGGRLLNEAGSKGLLNGLTAKLFRRSA